MSGQTRSVRRRRRRAGFTLLELLQVMVVAGVVMTIAASRVDWVSMQVTSTGRQAVMTLLAAQRLAVLRQHAIVVGFDVAHNRLRIHEDRNNNGKMEVGEHIKFVTLEGATKFGRGAAPARPFGSGPISFAKKQAGMPAVTFFRSGSASELGGFYITSRRGRAQDARALEINRGTGRASYLAYDGTSWRRGF
jgi:prepilin-type N-terminal cleavage/methylation domain-containing protein